MPWSVKIASIAANPVPNDTVHVTAEFTDGERTFSKPFKLTAGSFKSVEDVEAFLRAQVDDVAALYALMDQLPAVVVANIPDSVSNFQCRAMLMEYGLFEKVDELIKAEGGVALLAWEYAASVHKRSPLVLSMAKQLGLGEDQIDEMIARAAQIAV